MYAGNKKYLQGFPEEPIWKGTVGGELRKKERLWTLTGKKKKHFNNRLIGCENAIYIKTFGGVFEIWGCNLIRELQKERKRRQY